MPWTTSLTRQWTASPSLSAAYTNANHCSEEPYAARKYRRYTNGRMPDAEDDAGQDADSVKKASSLSFGLSRQNQKTPIDAGRAKDGPAPFARTDLHPRTSFPVSKQTPRRQGWGALPSARLSRQILSWHMSTARRWKACSQQHSNTPRPKAQPGCIHLKKHQHTRTQRQPNNRSPLAAQQRTMPR